MSNHIADENRGARVTGHGRCTDCDWENFAYANDGSHESIDNLRKRTLRHTRLTGHRTELAVQRITIYHSITSGHHDSGTSRAARKVANA